MNARTSGLITLHEPKAGRIALHQACGLFNPIPSCNRVALIPVIQVSCMLDRRCWEVRREAYGMGSVAWGNGELLSLFIQWIKKELRR